MLRVIFGIAFDAPLRTKNSRAPEWTGAGGLWDLDYVYDYAPIGIINGKVRRKYFWRLSRWWNVGYGRMWRELGVDRIFSRRRLRGGEAGRLCG